MASDDFHDTGNAWVALGAGVALATTSPDLVEGMAAFREKRDAQFDGT